MGALALKKLHECMLIFKHQDITVVIRRRASLGPMEHVLRAGDNIFYSHHSLEKIRKSIEEASNGRAIWHCVRHLRWGIQVTESGMEKADPEMEEERPHGEASLCRNTCSPFVDTCVYWPLCQSPIRSGTNQLSLSTG